MRNDYEDDDDDDFDDDDDDGDFDDGDDDDDDDDDFDIWWPVATGQWGHRSFIFGHIGKVRHLPQPLNIFPGNTSILVRVSPFSCRGLKLLSCSVEIFCE